MLVFLNASNKPLTNANVKVLGHNDKIPKFDLSWFEILLKNVFVVDRKSYEQFEEILSEYEQKLNQIGAIEKRNVSLIDNKNIQKYFVNSLGKLNSIGVLPIFKILTKEHPNLNIAILTGSLFVIPKSKAENLYGLCYSRELNADKLKFKQFEMNENYIEVSMPEKMRNDVMNCISKLFEVGEINLIVGTKSLLGEGWDEPSINSLILATFVGSYMLSNQMRGRAIRVNSNSHKTANIWHLVCVCDNINGDSSIENADLNLLKRRFESFTGIGYNNSYVSSGLGRLGNFDDPYTQMLLLPGLLRYIEEVEPFTSDWLVSKAFIRAIIIAIVLLLILIIGIIPRILTFLVELGFVIYIACKAKKIKQLSTPESTVKAISEILLNQLIRTRNVKTSASKIKIKTQNNNGRVSAWIEGASLQESNLFITCLTEIFSKTESQRYIISTKRNNLTRYYNIPKIFSNNKENAQSFADLWSKAIGKVELIYTKSAEGRKELLKARMQNMNLKDKMSRKQKMTDWK